MFLFLVSVNFFFYIYIYFEFIMYQQISVCQDIMLCNIITHFVAGAILVLGSFSSLQG